MTGSKFQQLTKNISYTFKDHDLLTLALTHRSAGNDNNERLEFLGDAALNFVIAFALFKKFPKTREGQLSRLRATLVKRDALAVLGKRLDLGSYLILGIGEAKTGGAQRLSILADAVEAVIGAIYVESGMAACEEVILRWYAPYLDELSLSQSHKDPKTELQEFLQAKRRPLPEYELLSVVGEEHVQRFTVKCTCALHEEGMVGEGTNRRAAEQAAAEAILGVLKNV